MRKIIGLLLICVVFFGCGKEQSTEQKKAEQQVKISEQLLNEAVVHLEKGEMELAIKKLTDAVRVNPADIKSRLFLSEIFIRTKHYDDAIAILEGAVKINPENGEVFYLLSMVYGFADKKKEAISSAQKSVQTFQAKGNQDGIKKALILYQSLMRSKE